MVGRPQVCRGRVVAGVDGVRSVVSISAPFSPATFSASPEERRPADHVAEASAASATGSGPRYHGDVRCTRLRWRREQEKANNATQPQMTSLSSDYLTAIGTRMIQINSSALSNATVPDLSELTDLVPGPPPAGIHGNASGGLAGAAGRS